MRLEGDYSLCDFSLSTASRTEKELRDLVRRHCPGIPGDGLGVQFHLNTSTMVSLSRRGHLRTLRVHWLFTKAPRPVLEAIVRSFFVRKGGQSSKRFRTAVLDFIDSNRGLTLSVLCARQVGTSRGDVYNLEEVESNVRGKHLGNCPALRLGWSHRVTPCLMGKWIQMPAGTPNLIVINRLLDSRKVPRYYLEYIVFHEMLHEVIPIRRSGGRWVHHPAEFRRRERQFPGFDRARDWESQNIGRLFHERLGRV